MTTVATPVAQKRGTAYGSALRFLVARVTGLVVTLFFASLVVFGALYTAPGSALTYLTHGRTMTPEAIDSLKAEYHLDAPVWQQYLLWLGGVVQGDFGSSIIYHQPVSSLIGSRAAVTSLLVLLAALIVMGVGLLVGTFAGLRPGFVSRTTMAVATALMAVPTFVGAVVLILLFAVDRPWFPAFGAGEGFGDRLFHLVLPSAALALASVAFVARLAQAAIRQELSAEHVQTAISRGLPRSVVVRRHVIRNAAMPVLTVAGLTIAGLIAGSVVIEQVFQLGGLGQFLVSSVQQKDFPVVQAICLIYVAAFIVMNTLIDIAYTLLDPRISLGRKDS